jgi:hypothetical protein
LVRVADRWEPDPGSKPVYDQGYNLYVRLYKSVEELFTLTRE